MGYDSLLFVATDSELEGAFLGWKPAIHPPRIEEGKNPFTGEKMTMVIDVAEYDTEEVGTSPSWEALGVGRPSIAQGVSAAVLEKLAKALNFEGKPIRRALSEPPGAETWVLLVEPNFVARWPKAADAARTLFVSLGATEQEALKTARRLADIARAATESNVGVYLVEEI
jgi:hypothetical protein